MEELLHYQLCYGNCYPFVVTLRCEDERVAVFEGFEFFQPRRVANHISVDYQPSNDMPSLLLITSPHQKIKLWIFL